MPVRPKGELKTFADVSRRHQEIEMKRPVPSSGNGAIYEAQFAAKAARSHHAATEPRAGPAVAVNNAAAGEEGSGNVARDKKNPVSEPIKLFVSQKPKARRTCTLRAFVILQETKTSKNAIIVLLCLSFLAFFQTSQKNSLKSCNL